MKIFLMLLMIIMAISGCNDAHIQKTDAGAAAQEWVDFLHGEDMPWDESREFELPEFPEVSFKWTAEKVTAVADNNEETLFFGMPVWNVFVCDLNGDAFPELCATISLGSGIIDERVVVYDYAAHTAYDLSDRCKYDYTLTLDNGELTVIRSEYMGGELERGQLMLAESGDGMKLSMLTNKQKGAETEKNSVSSEK